jgi:hypothetical protein
MDSSSIAALRYNRILELRRKKRSYNFIAKELGIAKSTVSYWLAQNKESQAIKRNLVLEQRIWSRKHMTKIARAASKRWAIWRAKARDDARKEFPELITNSLFVAGIVMYWGEGDSKPQNPLRLSNTDPRMIRLYVQFLCNVLKVPPEKIRLTLILYPDLHNDRCRLFWSKTTGLHTRHFLKTQYIQGHHPTKRLQYGICIVVVYSRQCKEKVLAWIDLFSKTYTMTT